MFVVSTMLVHTGSMHFGRMLLSALQLMFVFDDELGVGCGCPMCGFCVSVYGSE